MQITDRSKDVIKSGGEWISSIDVENIAMAHPAVANGGLHRHPSSQMGRAADSGGGQKPNTEVTAHEIIQFYDGKIANGRCRMTCSLLMPYRSVRPAKMMKAKLRDMFRTTRYQRDTSGIRNLRNLPCRAFTDGYRP